MGTHRTAQGLRGNCLNTQSRPFAEPDAVGPKPEYDWLIVGSGGASMCAALVAQAAGLDCAILEKQDQVGGSTAFSGGVLWVPNNPVMKRLGVADSPEAAERYFASVVAPSHGSNAARRAAFLREGPRMIAFLEACGIPFGYADGWSDYYDERPGGQARGRSLYAEPYDLNRLGVWKHRLSIYSAFRDLPIGFHRMIPMMMFPRSWRARAILLRLIGTTIWNKLRGRDVIANGPALQARMLELTLAHGIPVITGFAADRLIESGGRICGVEGAYRGQRRCVRARRGVLVNTGGFARNAAMRMQLHRQPSRVQWSLANPGDTGEMLEELRHHGAATENLDAAIWLPTSLLADGTPPEQAKGKHGEVELYTHSGDISSPHLIIVDRRGKRLFNEAQSYMEIGETMYRQDAVPAYAVFDRRHLKRYFWGTLPPFAKPVRKWLESGFLVQGMTLAELARNAGIDAVGLQEQVERFNGFARRGIDEDFHRGERAYDRWRGDPTHKPNPCLGEISAPPFYAIRIFPADVGTFGGVLTDEHARVLRDDGSVIDGLYAAGNCTSSVVGRSYPGAGASISASFAFGYIAALHAVAASAADTRATHCRDN